MKNYNIFKIYSDPFQIDIISGLLWELQIEGITEEKDHLVIYAEEEETVNEKIIIDILEKLKSEHLVNKFSVVKDVIQEENWNELWEKSRDIIKISNKFVIKPTFKEYRANPEEIVLTIDPKMSFGTGEHQSTKLILELLSKYIQPGIRLLDVGSGTGILSIASIKLGAKKTIAIDNDERCYENSLENCQLNSVAENVEILIGEISDVNETDFDLILANIQKNVLLSIPNEIKKRIKENGIVILSGLLSEDENDIKIHYSQNGFQTIEIRRMDEWIALVFKYAD